MILRMIRCMLTKTKPQLKGLLLLDTEMKTKLNEEGVEALQEKIVLEGWLPDTEQFGHLEYLASYTVDGVKYIFHSKTLMVLEVYRIE